MAVADPVPVVVSEATRLVVLVSEVDPVEGRMPDLLEIIPVPDEEAMTITRRGAESKHNVRYVSRRRRCCPYGECWNE